MTDHKHLKALIRSRMARTGERYSTARRHLVGTRPPGLSLAATIDAHDRHCMVARFTPDGLHLVSGGFSGQARVWRAGTWDLVSELRGHTSSVNGVAVDASGERAVTISSDRTVRSWDLRAAAALEVLGTHRGTVNAVDLAPHGKVAATAGADGRVTLWSLGGAPTHLDTGERPTAVAFAPHGEHLAVAAGGSVVVLELTGEPLTHLGLPGEASTALRWAPRGDTLTASATNGAVRVWSTGDWDSVRDLELPGEGWAPLANSPDGRLLAIAWEHHLGLWTADREDPAWVADGLPKGLYSVDFSADGRLLALAGADGLIRIWDVG